ncbi:dephospho-CoA kinase [Nitzschia inconspicua]|uniref:Dephospho-CoA kinase n=1 Tax=Nitzschia inconspicua TaxID=303405 RepID=A0A9K3LGW9_9STRA|nr:dephospho-CoA kinase [Nitzschia inconspicua]
MKSLATIGWLLVVFTVNGDTDTLLAKAFVSPSFIINKRVVVARTLFLSKKDQSNISKQNKPEDSNDQPPPTTATTIMSTKSDIPSSSSSSSSSSSKLKVLGVCGGIGSGKSTACKLLVSQCDCLEHLDADSLAHSVYAPGSQAVQDIVSEFGSDILVNSNNNNNNDDDDDDHSDNNNESNIEIDRKKLGAVVFADRSAMARLERTVWPHVKALIVDKIDVLRRQEWEEQQITIQTNKSDEPPSGQQVLPTSKRPIVIVEAAVLLDAEWDDLFDGVWVVTAPREVALQRLMETRGLSQEEAEKRMNAQQSRRGIGNLQQEVESGVVTGIIENKVGLDELTLSLSKALDDPMFWKRGK